MGCDMECGTLCDVERGKCGLWHGTWNVVRYGMRQSVVCGMECETLCDVE